MATTPAPQLRQRVSFAKRLDVTDEYGNVQSTWAAQFTVAARIWPRLGGETVTAARLAGTQPATITVRTSAQTRSIGTDWKATNVRTNTEYAIRSIVDADERTPDHGKFLDLLCQAGVAP